MGHAACGVCVNNGSPVRRWTRQLALSTLRSSGGLGELDAGRPEGPLRADGRAAGLAESVRRAVSEQDEGPSTSRARACRRRCWRCGPTANTGRPGAASVPPDAPLDFAPAALQPLIRHDGVTDRRRWESALFLKVRDEIQTGNLAIDGAKNLRSVRGVLPARRPVGAGPRSVLGANRVPRRSRRGGPAAEGASVGCVRPVPGGCR